MIDTLEPFIFEELKVGMYVWDDLMREIVYITDIKDTWLTTKYWNGNINGDFQEGRFYPVTKYLKRGRK